MNETEDKEDKEDKEEDKEDKEEDKEDKLQTKLPVLPRLTKKQIQEIYGLLEEEKTLEEISRFFQEKYKCRPLEKQRLQKHALKFHKLKRGSESNDGDGDNKIHDLEAPSSEITNQDIEEMKEKMLSPPASDSVGDRGGDSVKVAADYSLKQGLKLFGMDMKFVIIAAVVIIIVVIFLLRRKQQQKSEPEPVPQSEPPQQKPEEPKIKWV